MEFSINLKRVFVSFAQALFSQLNFGYHWKLNPQETQIFIADQYAVNPDAAPEKLPAIILKRGGVAWGNLSIDQRMSTNIVTGDTLRTDLIRSVATYICLSKDGFEAEKIANVLLNQIMGRKDDLRKGGIHKIVSLGMGEERMIRGDSSTRVFEVSVNVGFTAQQYVATQASSEITVTVDGEASRLNTNYYVNQDTIRFVEPPDDGAEIEVTYIHNISLESITETFIGDGETTDFQLENSVYGHYPLFLNKVTTIDVKTSTD